MYVKTILFINLKFGQNTVLRPTSNLYYKFCYCINIIFHEKIVTILVEVRGLKNKQINGNFSFYNYETNIEVHCC